MVRSCQSSIVALDPHGLVQHLTNAAINRVLLPDVAYAASRREVFLRLDGDRHSLRDLKTSAQRLPLRCRPATKFHPNAVTTRVYDWLPNAVLNRVFFYPDLHLRASLMTGTILNNESVTEVL